MTFGIKQYEKKVAIYAFKILLSLVILYVLTILNLFHVLKITHCHVPKLVSEEAEICPIV